MIVKENGKFVVKSADGKKVLGTYDNEEDAKKRLAQAEAFSSKDGSTCQTCDGTGTIDDQEAADETGLDVGEDCPVCGGDGLMTDEMTHVEMKDSFTIDAKPRKTKDGYLVAMARVARTGIQVYKGREVGKPHLETVRVYRPPGEVFDAEALSSFTHRPLTLRHPPEEVGAKNWKKYAGGYTGDKAVRDGDFIQVPMVMMDQGMIDAYEKGGIKELSMGYSTDLKWRKGLTDSGEPYDAVQTAIRANHLALVPNARGGKDLRVGDATRKEKTKMKIMVDGVPVDIDDDVAGNVIRVALDKGAAEIKRLGDQVTKLTSDAATAKTEADAKIADATKQVQTKDGEIVVLKKAVEDAKVSPAKLDELVKDRQIVCDKASALLPKEYKFDGKELGQIKKDAVSAKLGDAVKQLTTDEAISGAFNALTVDVKTRDGTAVLAHDIGRSRSGVHVNDERDVAFAEQEKYLQDAWKTKAA